MPQTDCYPLQYEGSLTCCFERHQPAAPPAQNAHYGRTLSEPSGGGGGGHVRLPRRQSRTKLGSVVSRIRRRSSVSVSSSRWEPFVVQLTEDCIRSVEVSESLHALSFLFKIKIRQKRKVLFRAGFLLCTHAHIFWLSQEKWLVHSNVFVGFGFPRHIDM